MPNEPKHGAGPLVMRMIERKPLTARRAAVIISTYTALVTVVGGVIARLFDRHDFHSIGAGIWWALQTVTTVGYGDVIPRAGAGRVIGAVVMVSGIAFISVITAAVTAALIRAAVGPGERSEEAVSRQLDEIRVQLRALEARLDGPSERRPG